MKNLILISSMLLSASLMASEIETIKTCKTTLSMPGEGVKIETNIEVVSEMGRLSATVTQKDPNGASNSYTEQASIVEESVKAGLSGNLDDIDSLNLAEKLITHALAITEDPIMEGGFSAGLDLRAVRSAKIYTIGEQTGMGMTAIVEAKNAKGENLGSFFGGFLVSPCQ